MNQSRPGKPFLHYQLPDTPSKELFFFDEDLADPMALVHGSGPLIKNEPDDYNFLNNYAFPQVPSFPSAASSLNPGQMSLPSDFHLGIADDELADLDLSQRPRPPYSSTPEGAPIQSPFAHNGFTYAAPHSYMQRQTSNPRSPLTSAQTPSLAALQLDSHVLSPHKRSSSQWGSNPESLPPVSSPQDPLIADFLPSGRYAPFQGDDVHPAIQSQEAKRKRRRESHNLVERRRRDNINEKIHELSTLVPPHRLDDDKMRKAMLNNNSPLSPILGPTGFSPPLGSRRTASASLTLEEKDKMPNKGDILTGSVGWTRDLIWALQQKYQREDEMRELLASLGQPWPFGESDDDLRMRSELIDASARQDLVSLSYSRPAGSGLVVPGYTDPTGRDEQPQLLPQQLDPSARRHSVALPQNTLPVWDTTSFPNQGSCDFVR